MDRTERDARLERVKANDVRLNAAERLNERLEALPNELANAWESMRELIEYYQEDWLGDLRAHDGTPDENYGVLSEDGVWNEMGRFYQGMQAVAEVATRIVTDYEQSGADDPESDPHTA